ncbi:MAG: hypothetical protein A3E57_07990 [Candidatus Muproteobacteria bacterium RIFCSPHIGHO2_12_FULL_60_33]|uniref:Uncharacterized protein n=1 Tax=Candidatus Muproteobacteria bacterium RIFCSPLOWO2_01_FULL_60_18 TaxID=1817768 RepID=A0A1F6TYQ6_9PROT|nr:MAG: hypothetical protein A3A87_07710 [Candidatus Muproteobacteria bacterium RIFCSPLOWO2_01_FULL_60_18]OGI53162.1 MAG: hypothetical protein A2W42_08795 [Candidatus Muproteobacteria bacterium RIFCSPHIGHO2_01_60_12]OGI56535.1 MAG: hypothetical protein A3D32_01255 [Candidatus Muproteobacteria bacterium RIFCSPHIGHO2_02_FULL_60_13]OGI56605.1 MAG: hypothetical protein A3E57_07990 [Candidatus Muproteobacteria bacterium RIFCSPHIGHO2_12_FULL_60_33]OGI59429.1 MAG: hypothetical protein A2809_03815 [Can
MSTNTLLVILLVWSVAGVLAAIAFGKAIQETSPDDEESLASSVGTVKCFRKNKAKPRDTSAVEPKSRQGSTKRLSV